MASSMRLGRAVLELATEGGRVVLDELGKIDKALGGSRAAAASFAKQHQESFAAVGKAAGLAVGAIAAIGGGVILLGRRGSEIAGVQSAFEALARSVNETGDRMLGITRIATKGLISDLDIMASANKALLLGLPVTADGLGDLAKTAAVLGRAMKLDATKSLDDLITALGRSSPMILDNLGLTVKVGEANEQYAAKLGKASSALTEAEKKTAFYEAAMAAARIKVAELGDIHLTFGDRVTQAQTVVKNLIDQLSIQIALSPVLSAGFDSIAESLSEAFGTDQSTHIKTITDLINRMAIGLVDMASIAIGAARQIVNAFQGVRAILFQTLEMLVKLGMGWIDLQIRVMEVASLQIRVAGSDVMTIGSAANIAKLKETRAVMEAVGDSFGDTADAALDATGSWGKAFDQGQNALAKMRAEMVRLVDAGMGTQQIAEQLKKTGEAAGMSADEIKKLAEAQKKYLEEHAKQRVIFANEERAVAQRRRESAAALEKEIAAQRVLFANLGEFRQTLVSTADWLKNMWEPLKKAVPQFRAVGVDIGDAIRAGMASALASITETFVRAFTGGGGVMGAIKAIGVQLGDAIARPIFDAISEAITNALASKAAVKAVSAITGDDSEGGGSSWKTVGKYAAYASVVGAVAFGIFKIVQHNRNLNKEVEKWNAEIQKVRDGLIEVHGTFGNLERKARAVGLSFRSEWAHQGEEGLRLFNEFIEEFEARISTMNRDVGELFAALEAAGEGLPDHFVPALQTLVDLGLLSDDLVGKFNELSNPPTWQAMQQSAEALGVRLSSIGPAFDAKKLVSDADEVLKHLRILERGGADLGGVLSDSAPKINALVNEALRLDTELPEGLQRFILNLRDSGRLVDENGDALTDLSRLNFAEPMARSVDRLIGKFEELINVILNGLTPALTNLPTPNVSGGPGVPSTGDPGFSAGTMGRFGSWLADFGRGKATTLHGRELVATEGQLPSLFSDMLASAIAGLGGGARMPAIDTSGGGQTTPLVLQVDGRVLARVNIVRTGNQLALVGG